MRLPLALCMASILIASPSLANETSEIDADEALGIIADKDTEYSKSLGLAGGVLKLGLMTNGSGDASGATLQFDFSKSYKKYMPLNKDLSATPHKIPSLTSAEKVTECLQRKGEREKEPDWCGRTTYNHLDNDYNSLELKFGAQGTIGSESNRNPLDFTTLRIDGFYKAWRSNLYTYKLGGFTSYETDQTNDNSQFVYGANVSFQRWKSPLSANNYLFVSLDYGQVDPSENEGRVKLLNGDKSHYDRFDGEVVFQFKVDVEAISKVETSYRHFYELDAPEAIKQTDKDSFGLMSVGVFFQEGWYLAFTDGQLPFSEEDEQTYQIGWSHNFF